MGDEDQEPEDWKYCMRKNDSATSGTGRLCGPRGKFSYLVLRLDSLPTLFASQCGRVPSDYIDTYMHYIVALCALEGDRGTLGFTISCIRIPAVTCRKHDFRKTSYVSVRIPKHF